jgi:hypothetical protein
MKTKGKIAIHAINSNDNPSAILTKAQEAISEEALLTMSNREAFRKFINRKRNKQYNMHKGLKAKCIEDLVVPESLQKTIRGDNFYFKDSGRSTKDKNRVILFSTKENLEKLRDNSDW